MKIDISKKKLSSQVPNMSFSLKFYKGMRRLRAIKGIRRKMSWAKFMMDQYKLERLYEKETKGTI